LFREVRRIRIDDKPLEEDELRFLRDVLSHPEDGVKVRYKRLGISVDKGNRLKRDLVECGWLDIAVIAVGRSRKVVLRPTTKAREALGLNGAPRESLTHEYWKRFYARVFERLGYQVELEAPRHGGRVDVLATNASERVGIEVETGTSDVVANVRGCVRSGFESVWVVATDEHAMSKVERELGHGGLLVPGRTNLVLRDRGKEGGLTGCRD
jgi:hypothetical protein